MGWNIAQLLSLLATVLFLYSITRKTTEELFLLNAVQILLNAVKNILLGGYSGAVVQILGTIRSYLKSKNLFSSWIACFIITLQIILGLLFNKQGYLGTLPLIASTGYSLLLSKTNDIFKIKYGLLVNLLLWSIYYCILTDIVGAVTNASYAFYTLIVTNIQFFKKRYSYHKK